MVVVVSRMVPLRIKLLIYRAFVFFRDCFTLRKPRPQNQSVGKARVTVREVIDEARKRQFLGFLDEAFGLSCEALRRSPKSMRAKRLYVNLLVDLGRVQEAEHYLAELWKSSPFDGQLLKLIKSVGAEKIADAAFIDEHLNSKEGEVSAWYYLRSADLFRNASLFEDAIRYARQGVALLIGREDSEAIKLRNRLLLESAASLEMLERYADAVEAYSEVLGDEKWELQARRGKSRCLFEMGDYERAKNLLLNTGSFEKDLIPVLYALGEIDKVHLLYRTRVGSELIAQTFQQGRAPDCLAIKSLEYSEMSALIVAEGGPGDEVRMAAFYSELNDYFRDVTVTCDPRLYSLLARSFPSVSFLPVPRYRSLLGGKGLVDRSLLPDRRLFTCLNDEALNFGLKVDFICSTLDVIGELRASRSDFSCGSHLVASKEHVSAWREKVKNGVGSRLRIGLSWRSLLLSPTRNKHYFNIDDLKPLSELDADIWILQPNATPEELAELQTFLTVFVPHGLDLKDDFEGQAGLMANMDFVVSPLTTTAELAGSLGVNTVLLAPTKQTAWRRNADGGDVWHSTGRIITVEGNESKRDIIRAAVSEIKFLD